MLTLEQGLEFYLPISLSEGVSGRARCRECGERIGKGEKAVAFGFAPGRTGHLGTAFIHAVEPARLIETEPASRAPRPTIGADGADDGDPFASIPAQWRKAGDDGPIEGDDVYERPTLDAA